MRYFLICYEVPSKGLLKNVLYYFKGDSYFEDMDNALRKFNPKAHILWEIEISRDMFYAFGDLPIL